MSEHFTVKELRKIYQICQHRSVPSYGMIIVSRDPYALTYQQIRFPRSTKRRIRKKWQRNPRNYGMAPGILMVGEGFICHPKIFDDLKRIIPGPVLNG